MSLTRKQNTVVDLCYSISKPDVLLLTSFRTGCSFTLLQCSGGGQEHSGGGAEAVLVRRPLLLQRLLLGPAQHTQ